MDGVLVVDVIGSDGHGVVDDVHAAALVRAVDHAPELFPVTDDLGRVLVLDIESELPVKRIETELRHLFETGIPVLLGLLLHIEEGLDVRREQGVGSVGRWEMMLLVDFLDDIAQGDRFL